MSELFQAASRMRPGDDDSWHEEWTRIADRNDRRGDDAAPPRRPLGRTGLLVSPLGLSGAFDLSQAALGRAVAAARTRKSPPSRRAIARISASESSAGTCSSVSAPRGQPPPGNLPSRSRQPVGTPGASARATSRARQTPGRRSA